MSKPLTWFRLYSEAIDDEKLRLLAFEDRWHFVAILCCKSKGLLDSTDPHDLMVRKIALKLGLSVRELDEVVRRLSEVGLIDRQTFQPLAWDERQFKTDTSAERTRQYRERMKKAGDKVKRHCDVTVTVQETETETETETEPPLPPTGVLEPVGSEGDSRQVFPTIDDSQPLVLPPSAGSACTSPGAACLAMKAAGIADTNPGNPKLRALLDAGADLQEFMGAAQRAASEGKGFAYAIAIVANERERAAQLADQLHRGELPAVETPYQRSMRERVAEFAPSIARKAPQERVRQQSAVEFFESIEVPARTVRAIK